MEVCRLVRSVAAAVVVGLMLAGCGGAMSLTEYAERLEAVGANASARFDAVNAALTAPDATVEEARSAVRDAAVIGNDLHADLEALDPPDEIADLHAVLLDLHRDVVASQQEWADSADTAGSVAELLQSPEAQAVFSFNDTALEACGRIQEALDATAERAAFEDVPWLPESLKESIEVALGCTPTSNG
jgi:hypothetical protein